MASLYPFSTFCYTENLEYGILYSIYKLDIRSVCDLKNYSGFLDIFHFKKSSQHLMIYSRLRDYSTRLNSSVLRQLRRKLECKRVH